MTGLILQAVLNSVWQGFLLILCLSILLRLLNTNATTRYALWFSALLLVLLFIFAPLLKSSGMNSVHLTVVPAGTVPLDRSLSMQIPLRSWLASCLCALLLAISAIRLAGVIQSWSALRRIKRNSAPASSSADQQLARILAACSCRRDISVRTSSQIGIPISAGFTKAFILIPEKIIHHLSENDLDAILIHEVAHLQRRDDWSRLLQKAVEAVFFFHPVIFWVCKKLDLEREVACDDYVLQQTANAQRYATCLTRVAEFAGRNLVRLPVAVITANQLYRRVEMLLNRNRNRSLSILKGGFAVALTLLCALFVTVLQASPLIAVCITDSAMHSAEQKIQLAEDRIWKAADEKMRAQTEQQWTEATRNLNVAQKQMKKAQDEMMNARVDNALARIHDLHVDIPETNVNMPAMDIKMPATSIHMDDMDVEIPETNVHMPAMNIKVPAMNIEIPKLDHAGCPKSVALPAAPAAPATPATPVRPARPAMRAAPAAAAISAAPAAPAIPATPAPAAKPAPAARPAPAAHAFSWETI